MPTNTARLGLLRHTGADPFRVADYTTNWGLIDASPGIRIITDGVLPTTWGAAHAGMFAWDVVTRLLWVWTGSAFQRVNGQGLIATASPERTTPISTTSTTFVSAVVASATVKAGNRPHLIIAEGPGVMNSNGLTLMGIYRDNTRLQEWVQAGGTGGTAGEQPMPVMAHAIDVPSPGTYNYRLNFAATTTHFGESTLDADIDAPVSISVIEL